MSKLIVISGIDSSGKSTQIQNIYNIYKYKYKTKIIWSRIGYTPCINFIKRIIRYFLPNTIPKSGASEYRKVVFSKKWIQFLWINFAIIDLIFFYCIYFRILILSKYIIIADRYIWDSYIDLKIKFSNLNVDRLFLWRILVYCSPLSSNSIILFIPIQESLSRSKKKEEPFSENYEQRKIRLRHYNEEIKKNKWDYKISGMGSIEDVWSEIKKKLL